MAKKRRAAKKKAAKKTAKKGGRKKSQGHEEERPPQGQAQDQEGLVLVLASLRVSASGALHSSRSPPRELTRKSRRVDPAALIFCATHRSHGRLAKAQRVMNGCSPCCNCGASQIRYVSQTHGNSAVIRAYATAPSGSAAAALPCATC